MANVFLVRHASIDGMCDRLLGRIDVGLNKRGRLEAGRAADACRRLGVRAVVSSPRRRAQETASIIASAVDCGIEIVDAFDAVDYGDWTGKQFAELSADPEWRRFDDAREELRIPGGEALDNVSARIRDGLNQIAHDDGDVVIVTDAEIIRGAMLLAESRVSTSWSLYEPEPASITPLRWPVMKPSTRNQDSGIRSQAWAG
jgi:broad specificity phosphatase PhoE